MDFRDVTLAFDDDVIGDLVFRDVTLAYDDDTKGTKGFRDVTLANDDDAIVDLDFSHQEDYRFSTLVISV